MKKKEFLSKLKFQKTTIVSFNKANNIKGGTMQGADTQVVSVDGFTCISIVNCTTTYTLDDMCLSQVQTVCTRPTNTRSDTGTIHCVNNNPTDDCNKTAVGC